MIKKTGGTKYYDKYSLGRTVLWGGYKNSQGYFLSDFSPLKSSHSVDKFGKILSPFKELNHASTTMIVLVLCGIVHHYESLTPSKSMPQRRNQDFIGGCPNIKVGTYKLTCIRRSLPKSIFFAVCQCFGTQVGLIMT